MNTVWDKIYKDYEKGGPAWACLSEGILPEFQQFIKETDFPLKSALDIGFGTGKYLKFLSAVGFKIAGIDSSETALAIAQTALGNTAGLMLGDMFKYDIPPGQYDLIISIATLHHGMKDQISELVNKIHTALVPGGKTFINLPNLDSRSEWATFKTANEIAPGTVVPLEGPEQDLPHSIFSKKEVGQMFSAFPKVTISEDSNRRWIIVASK